MKLIALILILIPTFSFSQREIKGVICNSKKETLSFTNIVSVQNKNGTATNLNGRFQLKNISNQDTLKVTNIAYHSILIPVKILKTNDTIFLTENIQTLNEVFVPNFAGFKTEQHLGFLKFKPNASFDLKAGGQIAVFIENKTKRPGWLKEISFKTQARSKCRCGMRIRILQTDASGINPGMDLLHENIIVNSEDLKRVNKINISNYKILMPETGIFIVLELLYSESDCDKSSSTKILGNMSIPVDLVWFNYRDKIWKHGYRPKVPNGNYSTPDVGVKVAF